jgi:uncharacterized membrane protein HdeD (DUF308 family)
MNYKVMKKNWWLMLITGSLLCLIGIAAIALSPVIGQYEGALAMMFGVLFGFGALSSFLQIAKSNEKEEILLFGFSGLTSLVAACLLFFHPLDTFITFTTLLGVIFCIQGILLVTLGMEVRPFRLWFLPVISGAVSLVFSAMIWLFLSGMLFHKIAIMAGILLLIRGVVTLMWAFGIRNTQIRLSREVPIDRADEMISDV